MILINAAWCDFTNPQGFGREIQAVVDYVASTSWPLTSIGPSHIHTQSKAEGRYGCRGPWAERDLGEHRYDG